MHPVTVGKITIEIEGLSWGAVSQNQTDEPRDTSAQIGHPLEGRTVIVVSEQPGTSEQQAFWEVMAGRSGVITQVRHHPDDSNWYMFDIRFPGEPFPHEAVWSKRVILPDYVGVESMKHAFAST